MYRVLRAVHSDYEQEHISAYSYLEFLMKILTHLMINNVAFKLPITFFKA